MVIRLLFLLLASFNLTAQGVLTSGLNNLAWRCYENAYREVKIKGKQYTVEYFYNPCGVFGVPATIPPGQPHYDAQVTVQRRGKDIATFRGEYIKKGCFEDDPEMLVRKALKIQKQRKKKKE